MQVFQSTAYPSQLAPSPLPLLLVPSPLPLLLVPLFNQLAPQVKKIFPTRPPLVKCGRFRVNVLVQAGPMWLNELGRWITKQLVQA